MRVLSPFFVVSVVDANDVCKPQPMLDTLLAPPVHLHRTWKVLLAEAMFYRIYHTIAFLFFFFSLYWPQFSIYELSFATLFLFATTSGSFFFATTRSASPPSRHFFCIKDIVNLRPFFIFAYTLYAFFSLFFFIRCQSLYELTAIYFLISWELNGGKKWKCK